MERRGTTEFMLEGSRGLELRKLVYEAAAATDRGRKRSSNEDAFGYSPEDRLFVVCDGMGGAAAGEVASCMAVQQVLKTLAGRNDSEQTSEEAAAMLREAVTRANASIHGYAAKDFKLQGMGTTLVVLLVNDNRAWIGHVGDSRCYNLRKGKLEQLTQDHSLVEEQVRVGRMSPGEALRSPLRNVITRAVGSQKAVAADVQELAVEAGDIFLLCSDGLTREVGPKDIAAILTEESDSQRACARLIDAANKSGGRDNITCLVVKAKEAK